MNQKLWTKLLASLLIMTLTFTNFILLGVYASKSYATSDNLENQTTTVHSGNILFDAYFKDEAGNTTHTLREDIDKEDLKLYVALEVKNGYLKNAKIQILGEDETNSNLKLKNSNEDLEYIETIDETTNAINLKQINAGTQIILEIPVVAVKDDSYDISNISKLNEIILTGNYVEDTGKEVNVKTTIKTRNEWTKVTNAILEQELVRFIPYQVGEKSGTILQTLVKSGITNNALPIEQTNITINVPQINGKNPTNVKVTTNNTLATNGKSSEYFNENNWTYDDTEGKVNIIVKNEAIDNKVTWLKTGQDEFVVTYIYNEKFDTLSATQNATSQIKVYSSEETNVTASNELNIIQNEILGQIVLGNLTSTENISKGYLYTKVDKETMYKETLQVDISYPELVDEVKITQNMDYFVNEAGEISPTTIANTNYTYYKTTKISKVNFEKILGAEGSLTILTQDGNKIATINEESVTNENGDYIFTYSEEVNQIIIVTSKPVETGKLEITHEKALKGNTDYSKTQVESFKTLKVTANVQSSAEDEVVSSQDISKEITFVAPSTKTEAYVSNTNLSTVVTNENVELRVILKTNDITCDLYKNPTVEIILPNYISTLNIKSVDLLFDNELSIKENNGQKYSTYINENGNIVITVNIEGEQTLYSQDEISKGANLIINTDITLKQLTPTSYDIMKVYVTNELATTYEQMEATRARSVEEKGYNEVSIKAVAPIGIVTTNSISGYNQNNETVTSMSSQENIGKLDVKSSAKTATVTTSIINNYQNIINQMVVLGRIPTSGSKNADTLEDFGSNLETAMASQISTSVLNTDSVEIYYSSNASATRDLSLDTNRWTKTIDNIANVKSYLIVVNGDIATGTTLEFTYNLAIPENLSYNVQAYSNYVVYFNNVGESETTSEKAVAPKVGIATGDGPELEISISSDMEGQNVEEGKIITYTVTVKNVGKSEVKNVTVSGSIPEKTVYTYITGSGIGTETLYRTYDNQVKTYSENIESIAVGETKTITYQVETGELSIGYDENGNVIILGEDEEGRTIVVDGITIKNTATASVQGYEAVFNSNETQTKLVQGYINIEMNVATIPSTYVRSEDDEITYVINLTNVNSIKKANLTLKATLPEGFIYQDSTNSGKYDNSTRQIIWDINTLNEKETKDYTFKVKVDKLDNTVYEKVFTLKATLTGEKEVESNEVSITVQKAKLTIIQSSDTKSTVSEGDTITYNFEIKNEGKGDAPLVELVDNIPEGLTYELAQYSYNGQTYSSKLGTGNTAKITIGGLKGGESLSVSIITTAKDLDNGINQKQVTNTATIKAEGLSEITSNEITHTIVPKASSSTDDPSIDTPQEGTHTISGIAWLDSNQDGKRDDDETRLTNIQVILINAENGQIVKDSTTYKEKKQQTNTNGEYIFANLGAGNYMVVFLYDSGNYGLTNYKQNGVNDDKNSDAIQMNVVYEGVSRVAGVSDKLLLANENIGNIDIGLVSSPKFDLKLDKVISQITVSDAKGTDIYDYKDEKLAKLDLNAKTAIGSTIMIEYKIRVTNEGGIAGYAKKIVDYMPSDMKFSSEINKDWYASDNGTNLYNSSLANTLIQPGETKELTLLLTKKITDSNMGIINNTAEIAESYNDLGLTDIDSTPANKVQTEDDISYADAIIGTKTGQIYIYIALTISTIAILGVGIYLIKKKVLKRI